MGAKNRSGGGKHLGIGALLPLDKIAQDHGRHHGGGHSPLVETGGHIQVGCAGGIGADIGNAVQRHAVLGSPVGCLRGLGIVPLGEIPQFLPGPALFSGAVVSATYQQQILVVAKGHARLGLVHIHAVYIRGVFQGNHIGAVLIQFGKEAAVLIQKGRMGGYNYFVCRDFSIIRNCSCSDQLPHRRVLADVQAL